MKDKRYVRLLCAKHAYNPMKKLSELAVYSQLLFSDQYGKRPDAKELSLWLGLDSRTAANALETLEEMGLQTNSKPRHPPSDWFLPNNNFERKPDQHWRYCYSSWPCYILKPTSKLTFLSAALYSWLLLHTKSKKPPVTAPAYLSRVLLCERHTVNKLFDNLEANGIVVQGTVRVGHDFILDNFEDSVGDSNKGRELTFEFAEVQQ